VVSDLYEGQFQSSVRINVGPNGGDLRTALIVGGGFQSSVRINVGPNKPALRRASTRRGFQSSVRINVGPNFCTVNVVLTDRRCFNPP